MPHPKCKDIASKGSSILSFYNMDLNNLYTKALVIPTIQEIYILKLSQPAVIPIKPLSIPMHTLIVSNPFSILFYLNSIFY